MNALSPLDLDAATLFPASDGVSNLSRNHAADRYRSDLTVAA